MAESEDFTANDVIDAHIEIAQEVLKGIDEEGFEGSAVETLLHLVKSDNQIDMLGDVLLYLVKHNHPDWAAEICRCALGYRHVVGKGRLYRGFQDACFASWCSYFVHAERRLHEIFLHAMHATCMCFLSAHRMAMAGGKGLPPDYAITGAALAYMVDMQQLEGAHKVRLHGC